MVPTITDEILLSMEQKSSMSAFSLHYNLINFKDTSMKFYAMILLQQKENIPNIPILSR